MSLMRVIAGTILMLWQLHQQETADICDPKLYLFVTKPTCVTSWLIFPFNSVFLFLRKHFNFVGYVGRRRQFHCPRWHLKEHNQQTWPPVVDGNDMRNERLVEWNRHKSPRWDLSVSSKKKEKWIELKSWEPMRSRVVMRVSRWSRRNGIFAGRCGSMSRDRGKWINFYLKINNQISRDPRWWSQVCRAAGSFADVSAQSNYFFFFGEGG